MGMGMNFIRMGLQPMEMGWGWGWCPLRVTLCTEWTEFCWRFLMSSQCCAVFRAMRHSQLPVAQSFKGKKEFLKVFFKSDVSTVLREMPHERSCGGTSKINKRGTVGSSRPENFAEIHRQLFRSPYHHHHSRRFQPLALARSTLEDGVWARLVA